MGASYSADLSALFDVGGIVGAIAAGAISDYSNMSATTCVGMLVVAIPMVSVTRNKNILISLITAYNNKEEPLRLLELFH